MAIQGQTQEIKLGARINHHFNRRAVLQIKQGRIAQLEAIQLHIQQAVMALFEFVCTQIMADALLHRMKILRMEQFVFLDVLAVGLHGKCLHVALLPNGNRKQAQTKVWACVISF